jgi:hypothetical protein
LLKTAHPELFGWLEQIFRHQPKVPEATRHQPE